jgi:hypothetical protein
VAVKVIQFERAEAVEVASQIDDSGDRRRGKAGTTEHHPARHPAAGT